MNSDNYFVTKWDEDIVITGQKSSRIELNKIIQQFNDWQICRF